MEALPTAVQRFIHGLQTASWDGMEDHLAPDALYDGSMPGWRAQYEGPARIVQEYREEWTGRHPWQVTEHRVTWAGDTVVVDLEARGTRPAEPGRPATEEVIRQANIFELHDGRIVEHRYYCCGEWDHATIRRIEADAPKVDRRRVPS